MDEWAMKPPAGTPPGVPPDPPSASGWGSRGARTTGETERVRLDRRAAAVVLRHLAEAHGLQFAIHHRSDSPLEDAGAWRLEAVNARGERWIVHDRRLYDATCELADRVGAD